MRKIVLALGMLSLMAGTAMAAEPLNDQKMDIVTAGNIPPIPSPPGAPGAIEKPPLPAGTFPIVVARPVLPPGTFDIVVPHP
jgi:hypothetical protein